MGYVVIRAFSGSLPCGAFESYSSRLNASARDGFRRDPVDRFTDQKASTVLYGRKEKQRNVQRRRILYNSTCTNLKQSGKENADE